MTTTTITAIADPPSVLALDLSLTATGVALPGGQLSTIATGSPGLGDRRLVTIRDAIRALVEEHEPTLAVVEDLPSHAKAAGITGRVHGITRVELLDHEVPYILVTPATLKLYAVGKGGGRGTDKAGMRMALYKRAGVDNDDDNQVDAAWLRYLGLDLLGAPELVMPAHNRTALAKVMVPGGTLA